MSVCIVVAAPFRWLLCGMLPGLFCWTLRGPLCIMQQQACCCAAFHPQRSGRGLFVQAPCHTSVFVPIEQRPAASSTWLILSLPWTCCVYAVALFAAVGYVPNTHSVPWAWWVWKGFVCMESVLHGTLACTKLCS